MKALVIGATGIIGNHVVRSLLKEGIAVRALSRGITPSLNLDGLDIERVQGDFSDSSSLSHAVEGCQWVFHTAAYYPSHTFDLPGHVALAKKQIKTVLNVIKKSSVQRFVYTSSLTTIGQPASPQSLADENLPYNLGFFPHPYFAVKVVMEEEVLKQARKGLPAVVVNPTGCFGPYELKPPRLCLIPQLVNKKMPAYVDHSLNAVNVADVGKGHVLAAHKGRIGERYILGGHNTTTKDIIREICRIAEVPFPKIKLPMAPALGLSWASEWLSYTLFKNLPLFPILGLRFVQYGQHFDLAKAKRELGYSPSPLEPCFSKAIDWYKKIGYC